MLIALGLAGFAPSWSIDVHVLRSRRHGLLGYEPGITSIIAREDTSDFIRINLLKSPTSCK